ncbi:MAG: 16S rRNA (cytosine(1402)-N(4))-methyltransferase RsmH [bacterium]|nr:16S rRNA (cytosine(1402)-N(4))-methyltransferase RsmH [bacterium]
MSDFHRSVMLQEASSLLQVKKGKRYIDVTLGGGGHTLAIAKSGGVVLAIDVDEEAIRFVEEKITHVAEDVRREITLCKGNFREIGQIAKREGFTKVSGILFDLGVSSHQFDTPSRGFSFQREGVLDMRMDSSLAVTAKDLINGLSKKELAKLFEKYGEEPFSNKIADCIVEARSMQPIETTRDLAFIIERRMGKSGGMHPATRVFQALRIAVNDELHALEEALSASLQLIGVGGRIVVISFHSLEDRIVKHRFSSFADQGFGSILTKKPVTPTLEEVAENPRARSAKMRVFERGTV